MPSGEDLEVLLIFIAPWLLRVFCSSWRSNRYDAFIVLSAILCAQSHFLRNHFKKVFVDGGANTISLSLFALSVSITTWLLIFRLIPSLLTTSSLDGKNGGHNDCSVMRTRKDDNLKPLIFPCRTNHTRFFPKRHSFSYSYLFVGIPVGWCGSVGSFLSADIRLTKDSVKSPENAWFSVESSDYLARGESRTGLRGKLDAYLQSQVSESRSRTLLAGPEI